MRWYALVLLFLTGLVAWCYLAMSPKVRGRRAAGNDQTVSQRAKELVKSNRPVQNPPLNPEARRVTPPPIVEFDRP